MLMGLAQFAGQEARQRASSPKLQVMNFLSRPVRYWAKA